MEKLVELSLLLWKDNFSVNKIRICSLRYFEVRRTHHFRDVSTSNNNFYMFGAEWTGIHALCVVVLTGQPMKMVCGSSTLVESVDMVEWIGYSIGQHILKFRQASPLVVRLTQWLQLMHLKCLVARQVCVFCNLLEYAILWSNERSVAVQCFIVAPNFTFYSSANTLIHWSLLYSLRERSRRYSFFNGTDENISSNFEEKVNSFRSRRRHYISG